MNKSRNLLFISIRFPLFLLMNLLFIQLFAQSDNYIKTYLSIEDGLSQNEVTSICQDKYGFMWFGTRGGLNRYDGYGFTHFKPTRSKNSSIHNPSIERLFVDNDGEILIGYKSGGFSIFNPVVEKFKHINSFPEPSLDRIISFLEDNRGIIWAGDFERGLVNYNTLDNSSEHFLSSEKVSSIIQTKDSTIWCGTNYGLRYKKPGEEFNLFTFGGANYDITELVEDPDGPYLWIVGWDLQLIRFNYKDFTFTSFQLPESNNKQNNSYSVLHDKKGNIWVGTWGGGLFSFNKKSKKFHKIDLKPKSQQTWITDYNIILDIFQDEEEALWIGTDGGGIVRLSLSSSFNTIASFTKKSTLHITSIYSK